MRICVHAGNCINEQKCFHRIPHDAQTACNDDCFKKSGICVDSFIFFMEKSLKKNIENRR